MIAIKRLNKLGRERKGGGGIYEKRKIGWIVHFRLTKLLVFDPFTPLYADMDKVGCHIEGAQEYCNCNPVQT